MSLTFPALLLCLILPVSAQYVVFDETFHPTPISATAFAASGLWTLFSVIATIWDIVVLCKRQTRGHRTPHALLLPGTLFLGISSVLRLEELARLPYGADLARTWAIAFVFLALTTFVQNRPAALAATTQAASNAGRRIFLGVHILLAVLIIALGTAADAYTMDIVHRFYLGPWHVTLAELRQWLETMKHLPQAASAFILLSGVDVLGLTFYVWYGWRRAGIRDRITNAILYAAIPLYTTFCILTIAILIARAPTTESSLITLFDSTPGDTPLRTQITDLLDTLIVTGFLAATILALLVVGSRRAWWGADVAGEQMAQCWVPKEPERQAGYYMPTHADAKPVGDAASEESREAPAVGYYTPH
ncbi:hypothetical protein MKEN_00005800 [Mycena kentingensis (nom. inval.)]|nr:hypothetical protein MKEN_00005800 [Mycena kentingensis (nom. inval.)]